ncbi:hypothetical protein CDIK_2416 [Cucumispora dikerogammari]|nr:hypothetical protein CDIK_2416 [Cucumispora dikerogammari]
MFTHILCFFSFSLMTSPPINVLKKHYCCSSFEKKPTGKNERGVAEKNETARILVRKVETDKKFKNNLEFFSQNQKKNIQKQTNIENEKNKSLHEDNNMDLVTQTCFLNSSKIQFVEDSTVLVCDSIHMGENTNSFYMDNVCQNEEKSPLLVSNKGSVTDEKTTRNTSILMNKPTKRIRVSTERHVCEQFIKNSPCCSDFLSDNSRPPKHASLKVSSLGRRSHNTSIYLIEKLNYNLSHIETKRKIENGIENDVGIVKKRAQERSFGLKNSVQPTSSTGPVDKKTGFSSITNSKTFRGKQETLVRLDMLLDVPQANSDNNKSLKDTFYAGISKNKVFANSDTAEKFFSLKPPDEHTIQTGDTISPKNKRTLVPRPTVSQATVFINSGGVVLVVDYELKDQDATGCLKLLDKKQEEKTLRVKFSIFKKEVSDSDNFFVVIINYFSIPVFIDPFISYLPSGCEHFNSNFTQIPHSFYKRGTISIKIPKNMIIPISAILPELVFDSRGVVDYERFYITRIKLLKIKPETNANSTLSNTDHISSNKPNDNVDKKKILEGKDRFVSKLLKKIENNNVIYNRTSEHFSVPIYDIIDKLRDFKGYFLNIRSWRRYPNGLKEQIETLHVFHKNFVREREQLLLFNPITIEEIEIKKIYSKICEHFFSLSPSIVDIYNNCLREEDDKKLENIK